MGEIFNDVSVMIFDLAKNGYFGHIVMTDAYAFALEKKAAIVCCKR